MVHTVRVGKLTDSRLSAPLKSPLKALFSHLWMSTGGQTAGAAPTCPFPAEGEKGDTPPSCPSSDRKPASLPWAVECHISFAFLRFLWAILLFALAPPSLLGWLVFLSSRGCDLSYGESTDPRRVPFLPSW